MNFPELKLPYPDVDNDVFVIDVQSNILEDGTNLAQLCKKLQEETKKKSGDNNNNDS